MQLIAINRLTALTNTICFCLLKGF